MDIDQILADYKQRSEEIPLGNSEFQNVIAIGVAQRTPERAVRAWLVNLRDRLNELRETEENIQLEKLKLEESREKAQKSGNQYRIARLAIKEARAKRRLEDYQKLRNDCLHEIETLHKAISAFPKYSREDFELAEAAHFEQRYLEQAKYPDGSVQGLLAMAEHWSTLLEASSGALAGAVPNAVAGLLDVQRRVQASKALAAKQVELLPEST